MIAHDSKPTFAIHADSITNLVKSYIAKYGVDDLKNNSDVIDDLIQEAYKRGVKGGHAACMDEFGIAK